MTDAPQDFSPQQVAALKLAEEWWAEGDKSPQVFRLFGYAGTGKTTLALAIKRKIVRLVQAKDHGANHADTVLSAAFTGKAALVMQSKGLKGSSTIHSLIYSNDDPEGGAMPTFSLNPGSKLADAKLCIIDECSMVSEELGRDLLSFGVKILVLGDPAQLPPVDGAGFFTNATPDVMLSEVHRQAEGNPIIRLSMDVRNGVKLEYGDHGACNVIPWKPGVLTSQNILAADQLLVGRNVTRERMNARYRVLANFKATLPDGWRQALLPEEQPRQEPVQRRALEGGEGQEAKARRYRNARRARRRRRNVPLGRHQGSPGVLHRHGGVQGAAVGGAQGHPGIHLRLGADGPQGAGLAVEQRHPVQRGRRVRPGRDALALHRRHARR
jgi:hypothetical protein